MESLVHKKEANMYEMFVALVLSVSVGLPTATPQPEARYKNELALFKKQISDWEEYACPRADDIKKCLGDFEILRIRLTMLTHAVRLKKKAFLPRELDETRELIVKYLGELEAQRILLLRKYPFGNNEKTGRR
jgi:hypothetical protein